MKIDTIAAIATAQGYGGIGIIRISGPNALCIAQRLFQSKRTSHKKDASLTISSNHSHHLIYGTIVDPHTRQELDEVLAVYMQAPHSYTCEDVVEFQTHGGPLILDTVLRLILDQGARPAEPGEFTRRAFLNGRIDLTQAEAVADMIAAHSERSVLVAAQQISGRFKAAIHQLIDTLTELLTDVEAAIEFPDDVGESYNPPYLLTSLATGLIQPIETLVQSFTVGRLIHDGLRLAIVGRPNVGKSSLLNALLHRDRAIVTDSPGTTRDTIEAPAAINGFHIVFIDTAGLHNSQDPIESLGIQKTQETIKTADLVLMVIDATQPAHPQDTLILQHIHDKPIHLVVNKIDLLDQVDTVKLAAPFSNFSTSHISALHGTGLNRLKSAIARKCLEQPSHGPENLTITNARHHACLQDCLKCLHHAHQGLSEGVPEDIVAIDLHQALARLKKITGDHFDQDLLDNIFKRFCIGK